VGVPHTLLFEGGRLHDRAVMWAYRTLCHPASMSMLLWTHD